MRGITWVMIEEVPDCNWGIGGQCLPPAERTP